MGVEKLKDMILGKLALNSHPLERVFGALLKHAQRSQLGQSPDEVPTTHKPGSSNAAGVMNHICNVLLISL